MTASPTWWATARQGWLLTVGLLAVVGAFFTGRPQLMILAAPVLVLAAATGRPPARVRANIELATTRCFEGDEVLLTVTVQAPVGLDQVTAELRLPASVTADPPGPQTAVGRSTAVLSWRLSPQRWGRWTIGPVRLDLVAGGRTRHSPLAVDAAELIVFPRPVRTQVAVLPTTLPRRLGDHPTRAPGAGVEFAGIRPYVFGDRLRRVNWPVSTRRGQWYVNELADERSVDLVVLIDTLADVGEPPHSSLDRSVRGAVGLAQGYLDRQDRVGLVAVGGRMRWLRPDVGQRQTYRIIEAVLEVRHDSSYLDPDLDRVPRTALPPGAIAVVFSPLLDLRVVEMVRDLRQRGFPLVVVDVLASEPSPERAELGGLALRAWRLDRAVMRQSLVALGVVVVDFDGSVPLEAVLAPLQRTVLAGNVR